MIFIRGGRHEHIGEQRSGEPSKRPRERPPGDPDQDCGGKRHAIRYEVLSAGLLPTNEHPARSTPKRTHVRFIEAAPASLWKIFAPSFTSAPEGEAAQSAAREDPSQLHGGGGREVVPSAQEYGARLAEIRPPADRWSATDPDPGAAARELSPCAPRAQATALPGPVSSTVSAAGHPGPRQLEGPTICRSRPVRAI